MGLISPCLIFRFTLSLRLSDFADGNFITVLYGGYLMMALASWLVERFRTGSRARKAASVLMAIRSNNMFMGMPAVIMLWGESWLGWYGRYMAISVLGFELFSATCGLIALNGGVGWKSFRRVLLSLTHNPIVISIAISLICGMGLGLTLPRWIDLPLKIWFPPEEELASLFYRSKLELTENVRIVEIPGIDRCACCAPHVERTGEVGLIKILTAERHRGGVRITALCGMDAYELAARQQESVTAISGLLSVPRDAIVPGVERLLELQTAQKERIAALSLELARLRAESARETEGNLVLFDSVLDEVAQRELVNLLMEKCAVAAVFSGSDGEGWRYVIGSRSADLRKNSRAINAGIQGRGGGSPRMIQGRAAADSETIRAFFDSWKSEA